MEEPGQVVLGRKRKKNGRKEKGGNNTWYPQRIVEGEQQDSVGRALQLCLERKPVDEMTKDGGTQVNMADIHERLHVELARKFPLYRILNPTECMRGSPQYLKETQEFVKQQLHMVGGVCKLIRETFAYAVEMDYNRGRLSPEEYQRRLADALTPGLANQLSHMCRLVKKQAEEVGRMGQEGAEDEVDTILTSEADVEVVTSFLLAALVTLEPFRMAVLEPVDPVGVRPKGEVDLEERYKQLHTTNMVSGFFEDMISGRLATCPPMNSVLSRFVQLSREEYHTTCFWRARVKEGASGETE